MRNYKLDTTLLPEVWVTWMSKNGRIWMNKGGKRQNYAEPWMAYDGESSIGSRYYRGDDDKVPFGISWQTRNSNKLWVNSGMQLYMLYAKYHADIERLELATVKYDTRRHEDKHSWMFVGDRLFIGKDKTAINANGNEVGIITLKNGETYYNVRNALQALLRLFPSKYVLNENLGFHLRRSNNENSNCTTRN